MKTMFAMFDPTTNQYVAEGSDLAFTSDLDKAKLYTRIGITESIVSWNTRGTKLVIVELAVERTIINPNSDILDQKKAEYFDKHRVEFDRLNEMATRDIYALSEKEYKWWRKMKKNYA